MCEFCKRRNKISAYGKKGLFWIKSYEGRDFYTLISTDSEENNKRGIDINFVPYAVEN